MTDEEPNPDAETLKTYEVRTIFGVFSFQGHDAADARARFWEWYFQEEDQACQQNTNA